MYMYLVSIFWMYIYTIFTLISGSILGYFWPLLSQDWIISFHYRSDPLVNDDVLEEISGHEFEARQRVTWRTRWAFQQPWHEVLIGSDRCPYNGLLQSLYSLGRMSFHIYSKWPGFWSRMLHGFWSILTCPGTLVVGYTEILQWNYRNLARK